MDGLPHQVFGDGKASELRPLSHEEKAYDEDWLQRVLDAQPSILPAATMASHFAPLIAIGREVATTGGFVDNLLISPSGYLTIVETKLWRNPQARREVVAQALDYASAMMRWRYDDLDDAVRAYTNKYRKEELGLFAVVSGEGHVVDGGEDAFRESVTQTLRAGRFLVLVVGDRIRESTIDLASFLSNHPGIGLELALVELAPYRLNAAEAWPLFLVPRIVKRTEIVERSVVEVVVRGASEPEIKVTQVKADKVAPGRRSALDESEFWLLLQRSNASALESAKTLVDEYRQTPGIVIAPAESSVVVKVDIRDTGQLGSLFFVSKDGRIGVWPETLGSQLERVGFARSIARSYGEDVRRLFQMPQTRKDYSCSILKLDLTRFREIVNKFLAELQESPPAEN